MSTFPCLDFDLKTPACVEWRLDDVTQYLVDPDPQRGRLMLESRFSHEASSASFQLHCPIRVKGIESQSHIIGLIHTHSITLFSYDENPEVPDIVRKKLNCRAVRLHFDLRQPLDLIVSTAATEPVQPRKRLSGQVFDSLRSLAKATALDVYISAREVSQAKLSAVCEAVAQNILQPLESDIPTALSSLYGGSGGKVISLSSSSHSSSAPPNDEPPSYAELGPPPPPDLKASSQPKSQPLLSVGPITEGSDKKRRRLDDSSTSPGIDNYHDVWATLSDMRKEMHRLANRVEQLERENKELKEELDDLRASCEKATDAIDADGAALLEVHEDLNELRVHVDFLSHGGLDSDAEEHIVETVKNSVLTHILERGYNTKITIEKS
ncbi:uncharacterized protein TRIVIDRAFT_62509 [Trichoderma virens Gv29-8]|uniref:Uncharacterized protein n=1 Tax=Hypocrea virens (strain Gv29-8 / FGSC 10586) TaxID=413071 RepID=G9MK42_HYPVG|nr:uncharacterized protein TRIVIDRAFT_62509 [Trichoderma virens Gv29-8]EHK25847.1 hypothetical protein TRIVIDRAFT_62509 [Trichoderma virens Gv29-8]UKZ48329.1 hypothetical protein TrVGV298_002552 [Trichoderma virens]